MPSAIVTQAIFIDQDTRTMLALVLGDFAARIGYLGVFVVPAWIGIRTVAYLKRKPRSLSFGHEIVFALFIAYLVVVAAATIAPLQPKAVSGVGFVSLIPGRTTIGCYLQLTGTPAALVICNMQLLGNIVLFLPMGLLLPLVWRRFSSARAIVVAALAASVTIEVVQFLQQLMGMKRSVDVDDVILNVFGALIGYGLVSLWTRRAPS